MLTIQDVYPVFGEGTKKILRKVLKMKRPLAANISSPHFFSSPDYTPFIFSLPVYTPPFFSSPKGGSNETLDNLQQGSAKYIIFFLHLTFTIG